MRNILRHLPSWFMVIFYLYFRSYYSGPWLGRLISTSVGILWSSFYWQYFSIISYQCFKLQIFYTFSFFQELICIVRNWSCQSINNLICTENKLNIDQLHYKCFCFIRIEEIQFQLYHVSFSSELSKASETVSYNKSNVFPNIEQYLGIPYHFQHIWK